jgi:5-formyltetrahydrofolate cyclo-ligase
MKLRELNSVPIGKEVLRAEVQERLTALETEAREEAGRRLCARIREHCFWRNAGRILLFWPIRDEINLWPLVQEGIDLGKEIALPRFVAGTGVYEVARIEGCSEGLTKGRYGIVEPVASAVVVDVKQLDLVLVPGVAFDTSGVRLGRGGGYYDRLLHGAVGVKCGVAFEEQMVSGIPEETHDVRMDCIATPERWIACGHDPALK